MPEVETVPELHDVVMRVDRVPRTGLVHLAIAGVGGLVLTREQAHALGRDLLSPRSPSPWRTPRRHARDRGRTAAGAR